MSLRGRRAVMYAIGSERYRSASSSASICLLASARISAGVRSPRYSRTASPRSTAFGRSGSCSSWSSTDHLSRCCADHRTQNRAQIDGRYAHTMRDRLLGDARRALVAGHQFALVGAGVLGALVLLGELPAHRMPVRRAHRTAMP